MSTPRELELHSELAGVRERLETAENLLSGHPHPDGCPCGWCMDVLAILQAPKTGGAR